MKEHERHGEAFEGDVQLTVIGERLEPGDAALAAARAAAASPV